VLNRAKEDLVMLVELSMVEQRYQAVREVLDTGANVTDVATRYGVDRRTLHRWLVRYASDHPRPNGRLARMDSRLHSG
jgi:transposase-like protein